MIAMRSEDEMVAYALETHTALLPYLPELLADLQELGSDAEAITRVLGDLNLTKSTTVVDKPIRNSSFPSTTLHSIVPNRSFS